MVSATMSASHETEFGEYVFNNDLTTFEALSRLEVTNLGNEVTTLSTELDQTKSELNDLAVTVDNLVVRVNTDSFRIADLEAQVETQTTSISELNGKVDAQSASIESANLTANTALTTATNAQSAVNTTNTEVSRISGLLNNTISDVDVVRGLANTAIANAAAAQETASVAVNIGNNNMLAISGARIIAERAQARADEAFTLAQSAFTLANQIFVKQSSTIYGWGMYNGQETLFTVKARGTSTDIMLSSSRFEAEILRANNATGSNIQLPFTSFWIRSPGEFGQWPRARIRPGQWVLLMDGGELPVRQMFIRPFDIRDFE